MLPQGTWLLHQVERPSLPIIFFSTQRVCISLSFLLPPAAAVVITNPAADEPEIANQPKSGGATNLSAQKTAAA